MIQKIKNIIIKLILGVPLEQAQRAILDQILRELEMRDELTMMESGGAMSMGIAKNLLNRELIKSATKISFKKYPWPENETILVLDDEIKEKANLTYARDVEYLDKDGVVIKELL